MSQRPSFPLYAGLAVSLGVNLLLAALIATSRSAPQAHGQAASPSEGFIVATEQGNSDSAFCFVLSTSADKPRLLVYKSDAMGLLRLMSARMIECDLKLKDFHLPAVKGEKQSTTLPPLKDVCGAVRKAEEKEQQEKGKEGKEKEKEKEKENKEKKSAKEEGKVDEEDK